MGGVDKGLQLFEGRPLVGHVLQRLRHQHGKLLAGVLINANRHEAAYKSWGWPVWADETPDYAGPLAGFCVGLAHSPTPWLLMVPCDAPRFPLDLLDRLAQALATSAAEVAVATAPDPDGRLRTQEVFCLLSSRLLPSLRAFMASGQRKIGAWTASQQRVLVPFDQPNDDPRAFANLNTLDDLRALER